MIIASCVMGLLLGMLVGAVLVRRCCFTKTVKVISESSHDAYNGRIISFRGTYDSDKSASDTDIPLEDL